MSTIAVIPARGGSTRIPRKNIREFCGKPMIAWSIIAARAARVFDTVLVSTDDGEIASVAEENGAEVPFQRPSELSDDHTPTLPVIAHAIRWWEEHRSSVELVCCIYATAPFVQPRYLLEGLDTLKGFPTADFVFSITSYEFPIFRALQRSADGCVKMFWPENELTRSQDLAEAWHDAGQFYWGRKDGFLTRQSIFSARTRTVCVPRNLVQDIDTAEDWTHAEQMFEAFHAGSING